MRSGLRLFSNLFAVCGPEPRMRKTLKEDDQTITTTPLSSPIQYAEAKLDEKLKTLEALKESFYEVQKLIATEKHKREQKEKSTSTELAVKETKSPHSIKVVEDKPTETKSTETKPLPTAEAKPTTGAKQVHPTEKFIEECISRTQTEIQTLMNLIKSLSASLENDLEKCNHVLQIIKKLNDMVHQIHVEITKQIEKNKTLPSKIEAGLEVAASLASPPSALVIESIAKVIKLFNLLLTKTEGLKEEELFLNVDDGIEKTILFLNKDFLELEFVRDDLQKKYASVAPTLAKPDSKGLVKSSMWKAPASPVSQEVNSPSSKIEFGLL